MSTLEAYKILTTSVPSAQKLKIQLLDFLVSGMPIDNSSLLNVNNTLQSLDPVKIVEVIGILHQKEKEENKIGNTNERKHLGIFYTDYALARFIVQETLRSKLLDPTHATFLEPCSGIGNFIIAYLDEVFSKKKEKSESYIQQVVNKIYCADIDSEAIDILKVLVPAYLKRKYDVNIKIRPENCFTGNLLFTTDVKKVTKNDPRKIFNSPLGFDIVITNPPYGLLKANENKYGNDSEDKELFKQLTDYIRKEKVYPLNKGTLNYYKLFVEEIVTNYTHQNSVIGLLIPRTILNDEQSRKLRGFIFENYKTSTIYTIPEKNSFFPDVAQAFCFFSVDKSQKSRVISVVDDIVNKNDFDKKPTTINISKSKEISSSIITTSKIGIKIAEKLHKNPKLGSLSAVINLRGELDLTFHKNYITTKSTKYPLIRGVNIKEFSITTPTEYVTEDFLNIAETKRQYIANSRLICQQVSNIHASKRLKFTLIDSDYVLGNSCNFLALSLNKTLFNARSLSLGYLLGILNSILLDWRFKLSNSNNHVSNYEINELPVAISENKSLRVKIERISANLTKSYKDDLYYELNTLVLKLYNLNKQEALYIASQYSSSEFSNYVENNYR